MSLQAFQLLNTKLEAEESKDTVAAVLGSRNISRKETQDLVMAVTLKLKVGTAIMSWLFYLKSKFLVLAVKLDF